MLTNGKTLGELLREKIARDEAKPEASLVEDFKKAVEEPFETEVHFRHEGFKTIGTTGYSALALNPREFRDLVRILAGHVVSIAEQAGAEAIAVRGTSGYSVAFAMRMHTDFPFIIARKPGEASHGTSISIVNDGGMHDISRYLILDDIVDSGRTIRNLMSDLEPASCVGVVEYCNLLRAIQFGNAYAKMGPERRYGPKETINGVSRWWYSDASPYADSSI